MKDIRTLWRHLNGQALPVPLRWARFCRRQLHRDHRLFRAFPRGLYDVVVDVGAHAGEFALQAARYYLPRTVCLVEADPELAERLRARFGLKPGWRVVGAAVGDRTGAAEFRINEDRASSSLLPITQEAGALFGRAFKEVSVIKVPLFTLDDLLDREQLDRVDLMKVDIQGGERALLDGARQSLSRIRVIYLEVSFREVYSRCALFCELHARLTKDGFQLQFLHDFRRSAEGDLIYGNACYRRTQPPHG